MAPTLPCFHDDPHESITLWGDCVLDLRRSSFFPVFHRPLFLYKPPLLQSLLLPFFPLYFTYISSLRIY